jgi:ATP-dependent helicase HrpB
LNNILICDLHGSLTLQEQRAVLTTLEPTCGKRKLILATNIAESALTIDGVSVVVDSGLARVMKYNSETGVPILSVQRISKASAMQRAGRAARQTQGHVYRMWTNLDENSMDNFETPEISRIDLSEVLLFLANQGISDFQSFSWYENPDAYRLKIAIEQLKLWQALDSENRITNTGKKMSMLPLHPRFARLMIEGVDLGAIDFAAEICAILSEARINQANDLFSYWEYFNKNRSQQRNVAKLSEQLQSSVKIKSANIAKPSPEILEKLLISAYPDRICRQRKVADLQDRRAIMTTGLGVEVADSATTMNTEFFIALQLVKLNTSQDLKVNLTSPLSKDLIFVKFKNEIAEDIKLELNEDTHKFHKVCTRKLFKMPLEESRVSPATQEEAQVLLPNLAVDKWQLIQMKNANLNLWLTRLHWYEKMTNTILITAELVQAALTAACYGEKSLAALFEKNLIYFFEAELQPDKIKAFKEACPESMKLTSGKTAKVLYFPDKNPAIEARLQEVFGWRDNPRISHASIASSLIKPIPITLILLGPNYRPVQITQDLGNFWKTSYLEIRKELRGRYPKHKWPEDPFA